MVNRPRHADARVSNYQRDGAMRSDDNGGRGPNYEPNIFGGPVENPALMEAAYGLGSADLPSGSTRSIRATTTSRSQAISFA